VGIQELPDPPEIQEEVDAFRRSTSSPGASLAGRGIDPAARRLASSILPKRLPSRSRLLVGADGPLHHVPFEALAIGDRFMIEDHEIASIPSATALRWMRSLPASTAPRAFLGIGAGGGAADPSLALPFAAEEIARISRLFDEGSRHVLGGDEIAKGPLAVPMMKDFRYVHFATHGLLQDGPPGEGRTGLWLGRKEGEKSDGVLTLPEVAVLPLDADLVVLSACRSGAGELLRGEGIVGLTRAFLHAGARSVVMTLWDVNDRSTVDLMQSFYQGLKAGATPGAALRQAKLEFIRSDRPARHEPYQWAPFVLVGARSR
jgi:CHAT domain-containing protein